MKEELKLRELCEQVINEVILDPPEFRLSLTLQPEVKTFEDDPEYEYKVAWKEFKMPEFSRLQSAEEGEENEENDGNAKLILKKFQENMEKMIWQLEVTVTNKDTGFFYTLSTWLFDQKVKLNLGI